MVTRFRIQIRLFFLSVALAFLFSGMPSLANGAGTLSGSIWISIEFEDGPSSPPCLVDIYEMEREDYFRLVFSRPQIFRTTHNRDSAQVLRPLRQLIVDLGDSGDEFFKLLMLRNRSSALVRGVKATPFTEQLRRFYREYKSRETLDLAMAVDSEVVPSVFWLSHIVLRFSSVDQMYQRSALVPVEVASVVKRYVSPRGFTDGKEKRLPGFGFSFRGDLNDPEIQLLLERTQVLFEELDVETRRVADRIVAALFPQSETSRGLETSGASSPVIPLFGPQNVGSRLPHSRCESLLENDDPSRPPS